MFCSEGVRPVGGGAGARRLASSQLEQEQTVRRGECREGAGAALELLPRARAADQIQRGSFRQNVAMFTRHFADQVVPLLAPSRQAFLKTSPDGRLSRSRSVMMPQTCNLRLAEGDAPNPQSVGSYKGTRSGNVSTDTELDTLMSERARKQANSYKVYPKRQCFDRLRARHAHFLTAPETSD